MRIFISLLLILLSLTASAKDTQKRIALLISSYASEASPELSYDLEELAQAYLVLHDNSTSLDIISPKGGPVLVKNNKDNLVYIQRFKSLALDKLHNTTSVADARYSDYDGVFIIGGGGAMMDLPTDADTQRFLTQFANANATIAAVCHGPAAIVNLTLSDGRHFIAGKRVNSFTNREEQAFSAENIEQFPFLIEDKIRQNGGIFVANAPMLPFVSVDENLITAQNPGSVASAAEAVVVALGQSPVAREPFKDEATLKLISTARSTGSVTIDLALATDADKYDLNYLALYGFYAYRLAHEEDKSTELQLMQTIGKHFQHPMFDSALIRNLHEQGSAERARQALRVFKQRYPEHEQVTALTALLAS
ncbi:type 1 glutamine amidotransferase domain-containing protein [Aestuariibacter salexigens]|uniref:type 1 glutamine amidotransferase domain-containing protein n=1 Tax=Aestuariibacter salexigens TaxID=226010 RepID=UPI0003F4EEF7|nr:type 1 glutamine amidotransferase domain-containing protein [Aestuariibacter salexigens]